MKGTPLIYCSKCETEVKVYKKEDFEKCDCNKGYQSKFIQIINNHDICKGTGYILPPNSKIKKVSELTPHETKAIFKDIEAKHNLKEDDELVIE